MDAFTTPSKCFCIFAEKRQAKSQVGFSMWGRGCAREDAADTGNSISMSQTSITYHHAVQNTVQFQILQVLGIARHPSRSSTRLLLSPDHLSSFLFGIGWLVLRALVVLIRSPAPFKPRGAIAFTCSAEAHWHSFGRMRSIWTSRL